MTREQAARIKEEAEQKGLTAHIIGDEVGYVVAVDDDQRNGNERLGSKIVKSNEEWNKEHQND